MPNNTRTRPRLYTFVAISFCFVARIPLASQSLVLPQDLPDANKTLDNAPSRKSLLCDMGIGKYPRLDFLYRYSTSLWINCPFGTLQLGETLVTLIRIKPEKREPVLMAETFEVPHLPPEML